MPILYCGYEFNINVEYELNNDGVSIITILVGDDEPKSVNLQSYYHAKQSFKYSIDKGDYSSEIKQSIIDGVPKLKDKTIRSNRKFAFWLFAYTVHLTAVLLLIREVCVN